MIVRFSTRHGQLTMFGDAAVTLLRLLGHSGSIPGAILAAELPGALARLRDGVARHGETPAPEPGAGDVERGRDDDHDRRAPVSLRMRAVPLIELIETAIAREADLMWERT